VIATNTLRLGAGAATSDPIQFYTSGSERMRIDSSGNLLVGTTDTDVSNNSGSGRGININGGGGIKNANTGTCITSNRLGSDGTIIDLRKDGSTVGSIGTSGGDIIVGTGTSRLNFYDATPAILPSSSETFGASDGAIDLGNDGRRFKDLYLSGGVYLGGTGAANKLDDYEEGTFTPADNNIGNYTNAYGRYTKIGNMVHCFGYFSVPSNSNGNIADLYLPFIFGYYAQSHTIGTVLTTEIGNYYLKTSGNNTMAIVDQDESQQTLADFSNQTVRFNITFHVA
jgi:hypothetical protein